MSSILPAEKRKPVATLSDEIIFAYGIPKVGKSSFFAQFPDTIFLSTEEGLNHLEVFEAPLKTWAQFLTAVAELEQNPTRFKTIVIDTADNLYMFCKKWLCDNYNIRDESDLDWGKGWRVLDGEFTKQVTRLSQIKTAGLVFISHSQEKEIKKPGSLNGETIVTHTLPNKARKLIHGMSDMILYFDIDRNNNRVIRTKPTTEYEAGDRTGRLPASISMGNDAVEAYNNFVNAYYGGESSNGTANIALDEQIEKGLAFLKDNKVDNFDTPKRVANSMKQHLGFANIKNDKITLAQKQAYLQHLRAKGHEFLQSQKENKK